MGPVLLTLAAGLLAQSASAPPAPKVTDPEIFNFDGSTAIVVVLKRAGDGNALAFLRQNSSEKRLAIPALEWLDLLGQREGQRRSAGLGQPGWIIGKLGSPKGSR